MSVEIEYLRKRLRRIIAMKQESVEQVRYEPPSEIKADNLLYLIGQFDALTILAGSTDGLEDVAADIDAVCKELYALRMENLEIILAKTYLNV